MQQIKAKGRSVQKIEWKRTVFRSSGFVGLQSSRIKLLLWPSVDVLTAQSCSKTYKRYWSIIRPVYSVHGAACCVEMYAVQPGRQRVGRQTGCTRLARRRTYHTVHYFATTPRVLSGGEGRHAPRCQRSGPRTLYPNEISVERNRTTGMKI